HERRSCLQSFLARPQATGPPLCIVRRIVPTLTMICLCHPRISLAGPNRSRTPQWLPLVYHGIALEAIWQAEARPAVAGGTSNPTDCVSNKKASGVREPAQTPC